MTTFGPAPLPLPLFDELLSVPVALEDRLRGITWSYSRRSTLEQCARRYYHEYFGGSLRTAKGAAEKDTLHSLKQISTRHERVGSILHLAIAWYLRQAQQGREPGPDRLIGWARRLFDADRAHSRRYPDGGGSEEAGKFPPILLREYAYRDPRANELCDEVQARLVGALEAFATHAAFGSFRLAGGTPGALIEYPVSLRQPLPCRVGGKVDLAYETAEGTTIVDWKLGTSDGGGDDSLQLAVYGLWAVEHFGCDPASLRVCKAHLGSGEVVELAVDRALLAAARARVVQDAVRMLAVQPYGEAGVAAAFSPCLVPAVCSGCPFQRACPEGRVLGHA